MRQLLFVIFVREYMTWLNVPADAAVRFVYSKCACNHQWNMQTPTFDTYWRRICFNIASNLVETIGNHTHKYIAWLNKISRLFQFITIMEPHVAPSRSYQVSSRQFYLTWMDCSLSVSIFIAATLVGATPGSLAILDDSILRRFHSFIILSADVILG